MPRPDPGRMSASSVENMGIEMQDDQGNESRGPEHVTGLSVSVSVSSPANEMTARVKGGAATPKWQV